MGRPPKYKWEFYVDRKGEWRWRKIVIANGRIVAASTEGYKRRIDCKQNAKGSGYRD